jgi:uncharacterized protein YjdB
LTATVTPANATVKDIIWSSSNPKVATVDENGKVHAVGDGTTVITVKTVDGSKTATSTVKVTVPVTGVSFTDSSLTLKTGTTATLVAKIEPSDATVKTVTWSSSDTSVATVSSSGLVTPKAEGTATITATTADGSKTATISVNVAVGVTGVTLDKSTLNLKVGDSDIKLVANTNPSTATNKKVAWKSSNTNVATVDDNGAVHAVAAGTAVITVTTDDGAKTAKCTVTISQ